MSTDSDIEKMIQEKGLNAPRLTPDAISAVIDGEQYHTFPGTTLTLCILTLKNGYTVTGESACISPENFDAEVGREAARAKAVDKIWELEGYLLQERLRPGAVVFSKPENIKPLLPRWKCHKEIEAFKIHNINRFEMTLCILTLKNGYTVTGESACISPENFDAEVGREAARAKAVDKIWELEGYLLQERLRPGAVVFSKPENIKPLLPRWKCHKEIEAFKIHNINRFEMTLWAMDSAAVVKVAPGYMEKHNPQPGGYYIRYKDGYESYSPAEAFEDGYSLVEAGCGKS